MTYAMSQERREYAVHEEPLASAESPPGERTNILEV
jgi:hypothetical protein